MGSIVPEYLRRPELVFEILSRGETPEKRTQDLRAQFRKVVNLAKLPQSWRATLVFQEELEACQQRVEELSAEVESWDSVPTGTARVSALSQLLHWERRISILTEAPEISAEDKSWAEARILEFQKVIDQVRSMKTVKETVEEFEKASTEPNPDVKVLGDLVGVESSAMDSQATLEPSESRRESVLRMPDFSASQMSQDRVPATSATLCAAAGTQDTQLSFLSSSFARLPHPLGPSLSEFRHVDGLEVEPLLDFLGRALRMKEFPGMSDLTLMELLAPICLKPLGDRLLDCLRRKVNFDTFHREVLELFVPLRVMERLKVERAFRPQRPNEALSQYVCDIREVWRVLRLGIDERQLVEILLQGLKPEERSRLVFAPRPTSLADLDRLAILSRSVEDADLQRAQSLVPFPQAGWGAVTAPVGGGPEPPQRGPVVCYGCGQAGHIRKNCRQGHKNSGRPKN